MAYYGRLFYWNFTCRYDLSLEFEEAIFGTEKDFEASHLETCIACNGTGAKSSDSRKTCTTCGGQGQVMQTTNTPFGMFSQVIIWLNTEIAMLSLFSAYEVLYF